MPELPEVEIIKLGLQKRIVGLKTFHFVDATGHKGYFLDYAYVYGKDKQKCKKCGTEIKKIQLAGRGTYFCPNCQKRV